MLNDLLNYPIYREIHDNLRRGKNTAVFGVQSGEKSFIAGNLNCPILYVASDYIEAKKIHRALSCYKKDIAYLPYTDDVLIYKRSTNKRQICERNAALYSLYNGNSGLVISVDALTQLCPNRELFLANTKTINEGMTISIKELLTFLVDLGYERVPLVSSAGEFSQRGDIFDIWSPIGEPVRIEFFDDYIESIKRIDTETNVSAEKIDSVTIIPVTMLLEKEKGSALNKAKIEAKKAKLPTDANIRVAAILSELENDLSNEWLLPFAEHSVLMDYLPKDAVIVWQEPKQLSDRVERIYTEHYARSEFLLERGEMLQSGMGQLIEKDDVFKCNYTMLAFQQLTAASFFEPNAIINLRSGAISSYKNDAFRLATDVISWLINGYKVAIFTGNRENAERMRVELYSRNCPLRIIDGLDDSFNEGGISSYEITDGFISHSSKLVIIGTAQLYSVDNERNVKKLSKTKKQAFLAVEAGDYVVHEVHGIGLCMGTTVIKGDYGEKDYIVVRYRNNDTLYVPVESSNLLSRYSGSDTAPKLSALGGGEFEKVKAKVKANIKELAIDLVKLYNDRMRPRGFVYCNDEELSRNFAEAFPYKETDDQLRCIKEIESDLNSDKIMDRLLVGDVGFGKTEVAMRAVFKVCANGYQSIVLAPTTILSQQHYETFRERFEPFNIKVVCLNRFRTKQQQNEIIKQIADGSAEIIIGTHRLLNKNIVYKNPGLLVLDEEQRFGVEHKEILKTLKTNLDVLSMSATPIPRTLHMALTGIRDISTITTPPRERMPVESYVVEDSSALIRDVIMREISREGQVYIVYNRVESIDVFTARIRALVPEARVVVGHGQMAETELEKTIYDFANHGADVLIATTIIENGINIPNANTLIVYDADKLGLSQLYQLRGRVGRSNRLAFAYFIYRENKVLSNEAYKRLSSIMENTELGSGFKIAMKDLEIRGAGNVLGREQHGHMEKVGYDTYIKLLNEVIGEVRGVETKKEIVPEMNVEINAHVPTDYIGDTASRMEFYQRMAAVSDRKEKNKLTDELRDIYGEPPKAVTNLLDLAEVKAMAGKIGISDVEIKNGGAVLVFDSSDALNNEGVNYALKLFEKFVSLSARGNRLCAVFSFGKGKKSSRYILTAVRAFCETALTPENEREKQKEQIVAQ